MLNEHPEIKLKPQLSDMLTSPYLVKVEVTSLTSNIDILTPPNTQMSISNMLTQIHYEKFKPNFMKNQRINASHWIPNYRKWITQKPTYTCQQCSHISQHSNIYKYQNQRQRRSNQDYFHQEFLERIHLGWIDPFSI